jgi:hypothetical protein
MFLSRFAASSNRIIQCALIVLFGLSAAHCSSSNSVVGRWQPASDDGGMSP